MTAALRSGIAGLSALALAALAPVATASAQEGDAVISNTETVNVSLDPSGNVDVARVYDQIAIQGSGEVAYANPVSTVGLRNLDEFGGFTVEGEEIVESTSVDGQLRRRALSDFDLDLPVTVAVSYALDGQPIDASDLVGKTGNVEVTYRIENMTGAEEEITYPDGSGGKVTETAMVYDPFAGSLTFTLPPNFTDVQSDDGFLPAGDGRGGTLMNLSVTLISGLTGPVTEASYTATVSDAVIPPVTLSFLPLVVESNTSTAPQLEALQGGVASGQELAANGALLDENVLALAEGAVDLVNGIFLLNEGAQELSAGLVNDAAPGANQLADGLNELNSQVPALVDGVGQLDSGGNELAAGLSQLDSQVPALVDGVGQLNEGAQRLQAGLLQLQGSLNGNPTYAEGVQALVDGATLVENGLLQLQATLAGPPSLEDGVDALVAGAQQVSDGLNGLETGLDAQFGPGLKQLSDELAAAAGTGGLADQVIGGLIAVKSTPDCGAAACQPTADAVIGNVNTSLRSDVQDAADGAAALNAGYLAPFNPNDPSQSGVRETIRAISDGIDNPDPTAGLLAGLKALQSQIPALVDGVDQLVAGATQLREGLEQFQSSTAALPGGVDQLVDGANQLAAGLAELNAQTGPLAAGVDLLVAGANELSAGLDQLNAQTGPLAEGVTLLADGGNQLADGLGDAAAGSVQLSSGLDDAAEAAPALPQGAQRLSAEGTTALVEAGEETAQSFGERVALLQATAERTADGGLPYGGPEDAIVAAAYRYDLAEATGATAQNTGQLIAGLVIAGGAVAGATVLARRTTA